MLDALLRAAVAGPVHNAEEHTRALVHIVGRLLARAPDGGARFDRALVDPGRRFPVSPRSPPAG